MRVYRKIEPSNSEPFSVNKLPENMQKYFLRLGYIAGIYPVIENLLFAISGLIARTPRTIALAFAADVRMDAALRLVTRLLDARKSHGELLSFEKALRDILSQLGIINGIRNKIFHHGTDEPQNEAPLIALRQARVGADRWEFRVPHDDLDNLNSDLNNAMIQLGHMVGILIKDAGGPDADAIKGGLPVLMAELDIWVAQHPWLYKSPLQGGNQGSRQKTSPKPKSQPLPSQG